MPKLLTIVMWSCLFVAAMLIATPIVSAAKDYEFPLEEWFKVKSKIDDPTPWMPSNLNWVNRYPKEFVAKFLCDPQEAGRLMEQALGFKTPDVVGKIAPEIKPGKYTWQDKEKYPGFKELMSEDVYKRFAPPGPPHVGNFPEIEIIPSRQVYWSPGVSNATIQYSDQVTTDAQGYIDTFSWKGGMPFPKLQGPNRGLQAMLNFERVPRDGDQCWGYISLQGYNKNLQQDWDSIIEWWTLISQGRTQIEPCGWYDARAKEQGERKLAQDTWWAPRDSFSNMIFWTWYTDISKDNLIIGYFNSLRRARRLSGGDSQDPVAGTDSIMDDYAGFAQKLSPEIYPYEYKVIAEREYLFPAYDTDGGFYMSSDGAYRNFKFERRPIIVVEMTSLDKNYVYGKRKIYVDRETFLIHSVESYDQKMRLYRTQDVSYYWWPESGNISLSLLHMRDHLDLHSTFCPFYDNPVAYWIDRRPFSLREILKGVK